MKAGIHPQTRLSQTTCGSCGTTFAIRSSAGDLTVETCSHCHPAYTDRAVRTTSGSRIERFERRLERARA